MTITLFCIGCFLVYLLFRLVKEIAYIKMYVFILKLQAEGKLTPEKDPNNEAIIAKNQLEKNATKWL
ncbi:MAG: hypothetical protein IM600_04950 [Bacteroidetes bacterium]|jgi:hypothetical protein|nr:hypothetical protein [Bacteroidota bacterium]MCA6442761.1 hypothetical protein [Bacteroidota bacterium]